MIQAHRLAVRVAQRQLAPPLGTVRVGGGWGSQLARSVTRHWIWCLTPACCSPAGTSPRTRRTRDPTNRSHLRDSPARSLRRPRRTARPDVPPRVLGQATRRRDQFFTTSSFIGNASLRRRSPRQFAVEHSERDHAFDPGSDRGRLRVGNQPPVQKDGRHRARRSRPADHGHHRPARQHPCRRGTPLPDAGSSHMGDVATLRAMMPQRRRRDGVSNH